MEVHVEKRKPVHIAVLPSPGIGHLNPLLEFSKRLVQQDPHSFSITFVVIPTSSHEEDSRKLHRVQTSFLVTLPEGAQIDFVSLPPPMFNNKDECFSLEEEIVARMFLTVQKCLSSLRDLLVNLSASKGPVASLVVDILGTHAFDVAFELGIEPYICFPSSVSFLSFMIHLPELDRTVSGQFVEMAEPVKLPGCIPIPAKDLPNPVLDRRTAKYRWFLDHAKRYCLAKGIILNSFDAFEGDAITALRNFGDGKLTVYPVGPLTRVRPMTTEVDENTDNDNKCLKWLDEQPQKSVLFVSFGSGGTLSSCQTNEIAHGLELSGERFLWAVRLPIDSTSFGSYISIDEEKDPLQFLPEGFLERIKGRGLVVPNWAPQVQILSHGSTGGFLTHCGWNSILESAVNGIPFIAWPLFAEQKMNALFLEEGLKVAFRVTPAKEDDDNLVGSTQIARLVKSLMTGEGKEMTRSRMEAIKAEVANAMQEGGTSSIALVALANELLKCRRQN